MNRSRTKSRRGLTLVELMIASGLLGMLSLSLAALAHTVETGNRHGYAKTTALQHGRVAIARLERAIRAAHATTEFPGFWVLDDVRGAYRFPEVLVVWRPAAPPPDPSARPKVSELVLFAPDPEAPNRLLEITSPSDQRTAPDLADRAAWDSLISEMRDDSSARQVTLTEHLRTAIVGINGLNETRAAVWFYVRHLPSAADLGRHAAGEIAWSDLPWVRDIATNDTGLRQSWCAIELHMQPPASQSRSDASGLNVLPMFGSAAVEYSVRKP